MYLTRVTVHNDMTDKYLEILLKWIIYIQLAVDFEYVRAFNTFPRKEEGDKLSSKKLKDINYFITIGN